MRARESKRERETHTRIHNERYRHTDRERASAKEAPRVARGLADGEDGTTRHTPT